MAKVLDYELKTNKFKLQSHYYNLFQTNTHGKSMNLLICPAMA